MQLTKFEKFDTGFGQIVVRGKEVEMSNNIDDDFEKFNVDPAIPRRLGENDIEMQIRLDNTYKPEEIKEKQAMLDSWNINHGFPKILFNYCKLDIKEYTDICRKWLGIKKKKDIKRLIRKRELVKSKWNWIVEEDNLQTFPSLSYLLNDEIVQWNADKKID
jgi:hypothetical protein